jgi:hypothetical protein
MRKLSIIGLVLGGMVLMVTGCSDSKPPAKAVQAAPTTPKGVEAKEPMRKATTE